jgi:hypothetical protein
MSSQFYIPVQSPAEHPVEPIEPEQIYDESEQHSLCLASANAKEILHPSSKQLVLDWIPLCIQALLGLCPVLFIGKSTIFWFQNTSTGNIT